MRHPILERSNTKLSWLKEDADQNNCANPVDAMSSCALKAQKADLCPPLKPSAHVQALCAGLFRPLEFRGLRPVEIQDMDKHGLGRRQFNAICATLGLSLPAAGPAMTVLSRTSALAAGASAVPNAATHRVKLQNGVIVPAIGQGSSRLGLGRHPAAVEEEALRLGLSLGMSVIDTSGNYGDGRSEKSIGHVIAGQRDRAFLVSKVEPDQVTGDGMAAACEASLARLGTDHLDLYLLHWPVPSRQFSVVVAGFERLRAAGRIRAWGVSNFNVSQMEALFRITDGPRCATNQVPYSLNNRSVERDLLPWCSRHGMPVMAYSPLGGADNLVVADRTLARIGAAHDCSAAAVALAWVIRNGNVIAIPESGVPAHVKENAAALSLTLTSQELQMLDAAYPAPSSPD
jgi:diketogulonate reductase-like aldo/keto reductase